MKKNAPLFAGITAFIFIVYSILVFVQSIKGLNALDSYSSEYASFARRAVVFELIVAIIILLLSGAVLVMSIRMVNDKALYAATGSLLGVFTLGSIIDIFVAYSLLKKLLGNRASMSGASIAQLVFLFIALVFIVVGLFVINSYINEDKAGVVFIIGCVCLVICSIISLASMDSYTSGLTITSNIFLLLGLLSAGYEYINSYGDSGYKPHKIVTHSSYNSYSYSDPSPSSSPSDASEQLRKLKKLFDDGVITAEEYEEKRKKYVDKL